MTDKKRLTDAELNNVTGGSNETAPECYTTDPTAEAGKPKTLCPNCGFRSTCRNSDKKMSGHTTLGVSFPP